MLLQLLYAQAFILVAKVLVKVYLGMVRKVIPDLNA
jgi:hypothetical protein